MQIRKFKSPLVFLLLLGLVYQLAVSYRTDSDFDTQNEAMRPKNGVIRGSVAAEIPVRSFVFRPLFLDNVQVTIVDEKGQIADTTRTGVNGNFHSQLLHCGHYTARLSKSGFKLAEYKVLVENHTNSIGTLKLEPSDQNYIYGTILLKDGKAGYYEEEAYGMSIRTYVDIQTSSGTFHATCNTTGGYFISGISQNETGTLTARCQDVIVKKELNGKNNIDLTLPGSTPKIKSIVTYNEVGKSVLRTRAGNTIKLKVFASDKEGNKLHYKWIPYGNYPGFHSTDSSVLVWKTPATNARYILSVLVTNGAGGVAYQNYTIVGGDGSVNFSGTVTNITNNKVIPFAHIRLNGKYTTETDEQGYFSLSIPENENERYVLNVSKPGYILCSKIFKDDATQKKFELLPSSGKSFVPTNDIEIEETKDNYTDFKTGDKIRSAAHLFIPKNSIVDSLGQLVKVPVVVSIRSVEASRAEGFIPGNFGGVSKDNKSIRIESLGSVDVQIRNASNPTIKYNLAKTAKAELSLPIDPAQLALVPASVPLWDYNEVTGLWEQVGTASKKGGLYTGYTNRFSFLSAGLVTSNGTYIVLKDNPLNSVFVNQNQFVSVVVFAPQSVGGVVQCQNIGSQLIAADFSNGGYPIVNLPANSPITIQIIQNGAAINTLSIVTGPVIAGSANPIPVAPIQPYDPTAVEVFMKADGNLGVVTGTEFLTLESNLDAGDADRYYKLIGAYDYGTPGHHITFNEWKEKNGYVTTRNCNTASSNNLQNGTGDLNTVYFNAGDLGFWRGLHQKTFNGNTSFYVGNYHSDDEAIRNNNHFASVCMEYSPIVAGSGNVSVTKFYIFDGTGNLVTAANLDGNGLKSLPGLCLNCHGGSVLPYKNFSDPAALQAYFNDPANDLSIPAFIPFDLKSYGYSTVPGYRRNDIEEELRKLNIAILSAKTTKAIRDFVNTAYNNNINTPGQKWNDEAVVDVGTTGGTWNNPNYDVNNDMIPADFYRNVVAPGCRSCHITRDNPNLWFDNLSKFLGRLNLMDGSVCSQSPNPYMPHAKRTYENFWQSQAPNRPHEMYKLLLRRGYYTGDCN